jgi:hypothetical protein
VTRAAPAEAEGVPQDVEQLARRLPVQLEGLALLAGHFPLGAAVAVNLYETSPVALEGRVARVDCVVDGVASHRSNDLISAMICSAPRRSRRPGNRGGENVQVIGVKYAVTVIRNRVIAQ